MGRLGATEASGLWRLTATWSATMDACARIPGHRARPALYSSGPLHTAARMNSREASWSPQRWRKYWRLLPHVVVVILVGGIRVMAGKCRRFMRLGSCWLRIVLLWADLGSFSTVLCQNYRFNLLPSEILKLSRQTYRLTTCVTYRALHPICRAPVPYTCLPRLRGLQEQGAQHVAQ